MVKDMDAQLMALVASGHVEITGTDAHGDTTYRLTDKGAQRALALISSQSWVRDMLNRLSGGRGAIVAEPPKDPQ